MTTMHDIHLESEKLLQQMDGLKFSAGANLDVINKDPFMVEFLSFKMEIAQGFIEELQFWEECENQSKCKYAIENTKFFLGQIQVLIDHLLREHHEEVVIDSQNEVRVSIHVPSIHEYVLQKNIKVLTVAA